MEALLSNFKKHEKLANCKQIGCEQISENCSKETLQFESINMIPYFGSKFLELSFLGRIFGVAYFAWSAML